MGIYQVLVNIYASFLAIFPPEWQWIVTLLILIGIVAAFVALFQRSPLFAILLLLVLPLIAPIFQAFLLDIYHFVLFLIHSLGSSAPQG